MKLLKDEHEFRKGHTTRQALIFVPGLLPVIDSASVADHKHQHEDFVILNLADNSVISDAVFPAASQVLPQRGSEPSRIFFSLDPLLQIPEDIDLDLPVEFCQLFSRGLGDLNLPGQALVPVRRG